MVVRCERICNLRLGARALDTTGYLPDMARHHAYAQHEPRYQHVDAGSGYVDGYAGANNDADYEMAMSAVAAEFPLSQQEITERPGEMARKTHFGAGRGLQECSAL